MASVQPRRPLEVLVTRTSTAPVVLATSKRAPAQPVQPRLPRPALLPVALAADPSISLHLPRAQLCRRARLLLPLLRARRSTQTSPRAKPLLTQGTAMCESRVTTATLSSKLPFQLEAKLSSPFRSVDNSRSDNITATRISRATHFQRA